MKPNLVFVYGTLRRGESNHGLLASADYLGKYISEPVYALFDLGPYPGAIDGNQAIVGEVYAVDDDTMVKLDELEEIPVEYRRDRIMTSYGEAWIYLYQDASRLSVAIPSGDWCRR